MPEANRAPVALVTGGRRGIGAACARALAARGFDLLIADLERDADAESTLAAVRKAGRRAEFAQADIADLRGHAALAEAPWRLFGALDCLVNNAGVQVDKRGDMLDVTPESFDRLIGINLRGTFFLTQAVARRMAEENRAPGGPHRSIVTVSSVNAWMVSLTRVEYCMSKAGLAMMSKAFALRLAPYAIHAYEVQPGVIRTAMTAPARERYDGQIAEGLVPAGRWGEADEVGRAVAMLAAGEMPFSTGDAFRVDGGLHIQRL